jgi:hypothetical protein
MAIHECGTKFVAVEDKSAGGPRTCTIYGSRIRRFDFEVMLP